MKKKVLIISITMSFAIFGCGNAKATNTEVKETPTQEQVRQTQEQEVKKDERQYEEYEYFFSTDELDLDNPDSAINFNDLSPNGEYCGEYKLLNSVTLYASKNGTTYEIGYTKPNIPITCFNSSDDWIDLYFENEESPNDYRLIKVSDFLANYAPADPIGGVSPNRVGDTAKLQKFVEDENYYTPEEFWTKVKEKITGNSVERDSKEGLFENGLYSTYLSKSGNIDGNVESFARELSEFNEYYIEFVCATDEYCDWIIYSDKQQGKETQSNAVNIYDNIQAWEIRFFDKIPEYSQVNIDTENLEDATDINRIVVGGDALSLYDQEGYMVGILGIGDGITPKVIKKDSKNGYLLIETNEGNFFVEGGSFNSNSYDPNVEHLITIEDFMKNLENACKISDISIKDTKDGLTETYSSNVTRKSRVSEGNLEDQFKEIKHYMNITEIYVENVKEDGINITFDVYYK